MQNPRNRQDTQNPRNSSVQATPDVGVIARGLTPEADRSGRSRGAAGKKTTSRPKIDEVADVQRLGEEIEQLEASNAALREAFTTVAHELRTPLASIVAYNDLLLRNKSGSISQKELGQLAIIRRNAGLLDFLVQDLTEMARINSGALPIRPGVFDAADMIQEVSDSVRPFFDANQQTLKILSPPPDTWVTGDSVRLQQVIANLLTNASKFSPRSSQIDLSAEVIGPDFRVQVIDRGVGIARQDRGKLFSSFFRAGDYSSEGLGLGLYIARSIVQAHGGEISVKSKKGRGTTMTFTVPRIGPQIGDDAGSHTPGDSAESNAHGIDQTRIRAGF